MRSSLAVADYLLHKAEKANASLTPMQIIKLVYLCHGWMLGLHGQRLIEEDVEAWRYGPVIRNLYHAVKQFRANPVEPPLAGDPEVINKFNAEEKNIMDQVFDIYGKYTGLQLSQLTHTDGSPWHKTRQTSRTGLEVIPNDLIKEHFQELAAQS